MRTHPTKKNAGLTSASAHLLKGASLGDLLNNKYGTCMRGQFPSKQKQDKAKRNEGNCWQKLTLLIAIILLLGCPPLHAADATFTWTANTESNLAGYRIHYGSSSKNYDKVVEIPKTETTATISALTPGQVYYFAATAFDTDNFESAYSTEVTWTATTTGNTAPLATGTSAVTIEGSPVSGMLTATDSDNNTLTYSIVTNGALGAAVLTNAATGAFTYIPNVSTTGTDSFTFKVNDGTVDSNIATVTVTINKLIVNSTPLAIAMNTSTNEGNALIGTLSATDADNDPLTFQIVSNGTLGNVVLNNNGTGAFTYTPNAQATGTDSFTFKVNDGKIDSNIATVLVTINKVNVAPVAANSSIVTTAGVAATGSCIATDQDNDSLTYQVVTNGSKGSAVITNSGTGAFIYTPTNAEVTGTDSFTFKANDGSVDSNTARVTIDIAAAGKATATFTWTANTEANLAGYRIHYGVSSRNYTQVIEVPKTETTSIVKGLTEGQTYYFAATAFDTDNFESAYSTEVVWMAQVSNSPPVASGGSLETTEGNSVSGVLSAADPDHDTLTYSIINNGSLGAAVITNAATGAFVYIPNNKASGTDSITFKASDGTYESNIATVSITIHPVAVNVSPVASIQYQASIDSPYTIEFNGLSSTDSDGQIATYAWNFGDGATGSGPAINHTYSIAGDYSVSLTVTDNSGATAQDVAVVSIVAVAANIPPTAAFTYTVSADNSSVLNYDGSGSQDQDGEIVSYSWNFGDGEVGTGEIIQHKYQISGTYSVTLIVLDNDGETAKKVVVADVTVPPFVMETGEVNITGTWQWVQFSEPFENPVVVVTPASSNDILTGVIRIKDVQKTGFNVRFQNWAYQKVTKHGLEKVGYIILESGAHDLGNGNWVEAGRFATDKTDAFDQRNFTHQFQKVPVVVTSINTVKEAAAVTGRVKNVGTSGFEYKMQEQQSSTTPQHLQETVSYIAWETSSGNVGDLTYEVRATQQSVTDAWFTVKFNTLFGLAPILVADMQTAADADPANLRLQLLTAADAQVKIEEEKSVDANSGHLAESVGFIALGIIERAPGGLTSDGDSDADIDGRDFMPYLEGTSSQTMEEIAAQFGLIK